MNPDDIDSDDPAWEALWTLSGAYLHQDYGADFDDWSAAARAYRSESDPSMVASAIEQIDVLLKNLSGDKEVERALDKLGIGYNPHAHGWTYRRWLTEVASVLHGE